MLGLNDRHIAKKGTFEKQGPVDSKIDVAYVLRRNPDVIDGYVAATDLLKNRCPDAFKGWRAEMLGQMFASPNFRQNYYFVTNAPYHLLDRAIFVRASFYARARGQGMQAIPVNQLVLYTPRCVAHPQPSAATRILKRLHLADR